MFATGFKLVSSSTVLFAYSEFPHGIPYEAVRAFASKLAELLHNRHLKASQLDYMHLESQRSYIIFHSLLKHKCFDKW